MERDGVSRGPPTNRSSRSKLPFRTIYITGFLFLIAFAAVVGLLSSWKSGTTTLLGKMKYYFLPASAIRYNPKTHQEVLSQEFSHLEPDQMRIFHQGSLLYEIAPNQTIAPPGAFRSCAISSLILQAQLVINGWGVCGYLLDEADELDMRNSSHYSESIALTAISAPPNKTDCTPSVMDSDPDCITKFVRTLLRNDPKTLQQCLSKVKGVSQTCKAYKSCGPRIHIEGAPPEPETDPPRPPPGVCETPRLSYYREEEVLRMCGICDMFDALMPPGFESPSAFFAYSLPATWDKPPPPPRRPTGDPWVWVYFIGVPLAAVGVAALVFICISSAGARPA